MLDKIMRVHERECGVKMKVVVPGDVTRNELVGWKTFGRKEE
jgi:hypothetical protein